MPRVPTACRLGPLLGLAAVLAVLAACRENSTPKSCYDLYGTGYAYDFNGDTSIVFHWPASYMPLRVYADSVGELRADTRAGMDLWVSAFQCHEVSYTMVADSTTADIVVRNPAALPAVVVRGMREMHADSVGACHGVTQFATDSDTTALVGPMRSYVAAFPGADTAAARACYHFITAHELGHALGLLSESPNFGDLMFAAPTQAQLTDNDKFTIQYLYHVKSRLGPPPRP